MSKSLEIKGGYLVITDTVSNEEKSFLKGQGKYEWEGKTFHIKDGINPNYSESYQFSDLADSAGSPWADQDTLKDWLQINFNSATGGSVAGVGNREVVYSNSLKIGDITSGDLLATGTGLSNVPGFNITADGLQILNTMSPPSGAGSVTANKSGLTIIKLLEYGWTCMNRFRVQYKFKMGGVVNTNRRYVGFGQLGEGVKTPRSNGGWMTVASTGASRTFEGFSEVGTILDDITPTSVVEIDAYSWDKQLMIITTIDGVVQPVYKGSSNMEDDLKGRTPGNFALYAYGGDVEAVWDVEITDLSGESKTLFIGNSISDEWGLYSKSGFWNYINQMQQLTPNFLDKLAKSGSIAADFIPIAHEIVRKARENVVFVLGANELILGRTPAQVATDYDNLANAILALEPSLNISIVLMPCAFNLSIGDINTAISSWATTNGHTVIDAQSVLMPTPTSTSMYPEYSNDTPDTHLGFIGHKVLAEYIVDNHPEIL